MGEPTRSELQAKLEERDSIIADLARRLEALENAPKLTSSEQARLAAAEAELARLHPGANAVLAGGPAPKLIPYNGLVQAKADCHVGGAYRYGPSVDRKYGDVFPVSVSALWSDDPFVAVIVTGTRDDGTPITEPNPLAPPPIDFRFRPRGLDAIALTEGQVRTAAQY